MTNEEIQRLHEQCSTPDQEVPRDQKSFALFETHISWVFVGANYAYKIKKPITLSFLDFSSLAIRKYYCEREIELNNRLTDNIYVGVCPVLEAGGKIWIGKEGEQDHIIDYAVKMASLATARRMDHMLKGNHVNESHIKAVAETLAPFHRHTETIEKRNEAAEMRKNFNDISNQKDYLKEQIGSDVGYVIDEAITVSDNFLERFGWLLRERSNDGYVKDCHGDLHSGNIFLYDKPIIFDCIEFNDNFRQIDVLDEIAFFCMDLEFTGRQDFSRLFLRHYLAQYPCMSSSEEEKLFRYYKLHRANIKTKVSAIKARQAPTAGDQKARLDKAKAYLWLMKSYAGKL